MVWGGDEQIDRPEDRFDHVFAEQGGVAGRFYDIHWETPSYERDANGNPIPLESGDDRLPLPHGSLDRGELASVHQALAVSDPDAYVYVAVRHLHLGVPVLTVAVSVGVRGRVSEAAILHREPRDGFVKFIAECRHTALANLCGPTRKLLEHVAREHLTAIIAVLRERERNIEHE